MPSKKTKKLGTMPKKASTLKGKKRSNATITAMPIAYNTMVRSRTPVQKTVNGAFVLSKDEICIDSITVTPTYEVSDNVVIQPAINAYSRGQPMATWLPSIARKYDNYCFKQLRFEFVSSAAATDRGTIVLSYDPNPDNNVPQTFAGAMNAKFSASGPVRQNLSLDISAGVSGRKLLTRIGQATGYPLYDAGRLTVATTDGYEGLKVGYIRVIYTIELTNPQVEDVSPGFDLIYTPPFACVSYGNNNTQMLYFGSANASRDFTNFTEVLFGTSSPKYGTPLYSKQMTTRSGNPLSIQSVFSNAKYFIAGGLPIHYLRFNQLGTYKLRVTIPGDWQNVATFAMEMWVWRSDQTIGNSTPTPCVYKAVKPDGTAVNVPSDWGITRGFEAPNLGPTPSDMGMVFETVFSVYGLNDSFTLATGIREIIGLSENESATWVYVAGADRKSVV